MKKIKLLMPLLGVAATAGAVLPAAVSCGNGGGQEEKAEIKITEPTNKKSNVETIGDAATGYQTKITIAGFTIEGVDSLDDLTLNVETDAFQKGDFDYTAKLVAEETPTNADGIKFSIVITVDDDNYFLPDLYQLFMTITNKEDKILWASADYYVNILTKVREPEIKTATISGDWYNFPNFVIEHFDWSLLDNYVPILIKGDVTGWEDDTTNWLNLKDNAEFVALFARDGTTTDTATLSVQDNRATKEGNVDFHLAIASFIWIPNEGYVVDGVVLEPSNDITYTLQLA